MRKDPYKIVCISAVVMFFIAMTYFGMGAMLDEIATWRNNGLSAADARCASAFKLEVD